MPNTLGTTEILARAEALISANTPVWGPGPGVAAEKRGAPSQRQEFDGMNLPGFELTPRSWTVGS